VFERPVHEDEEQEQAGEAEQQGEAVDLEAGEEPNRTAERVRQRQDEVQKPGGRAPVRKGPALNRFVDDALRQVERGEIERQRRENDQKNDELVAARMAPDVAEQALVHCG